MSKESEAKERQIGLAEFIDDYGIGETLSIIASILLQKQEQKKKALADQIVSLID